MEDTQWGRNNWWTKRFYSKVWFFLIPFPIRFAKGIRNYSYMWSGILLTNRPNFSSVLMSGFVIVWYDELFTTNLFCGPNYCWVIFSSETQLILLESQSVTCIFSAVFGWIARVIWLVGLKVDFVVRLLSNWSKVTWRVVIAARF